MLSSSFLVGVLFDVGVSSVFVHGFVFVISIFCESCGGFDVLVAVVPAVD